MQTHLEAILDQHTQCSWDKGRRDGLFLVDKESCGKFLPTYNGAGEGHLPPASSAVSERRHRQQLRNLLALRCAQVVDKAASFQVNTNRKVN